MPHTKSKYRPGHDETTKKRVGEAQWYAETLSETAYGSLKGRFARLIRSDVNLKDSTRLVGCLLTDLTNQQYGGKAWPSLGTIGDAVGKSRRTVQRAIKELEQAGWFTIIEGRGRGNGSEYLPNFEKVSDVSSFNGDESEIEGDQTEKVPSTTEKVPTKSEKVSSVAQNNNRDSLDKFKTAPDSKTGSEETNVVPLRRGTGLSEKERRDKAAFQQAQNRVVERLGGWHAVMKSSDQSRLDWLTKHELDGMDLTEGISFEADQVIAEEGTG